MDKRKTMLYGDNPIYPTDYEEQLRTLAEDEQMREFRLARETRRDDPYRPDYHFVRPDGYLNDPNGLCFWEGRWHLFYQANDERIHWGHAVSDDLLRWRDLPFAIYPRRELHCFSGGTCVDEENHRVIAAYYGYTGYDANGWKCGTVIATSSDPLLLNWTKVNDGIPVIPDADAPCWTPEGQEPFEGQKPYQVFDSCIWKEDGVYYILTAGYARNEKTDRYFREMFLFKCENDDLTEWEYVKPFMGNDTFRAAGDDGACPYFTKMGDKYLLSHFSHRAMPKYLLGEYDKENHVFTPQNGGNYISGYNMMVAPSVYGTGDGRAVVLFNTTEQRPSAGGWNGTLTLPRRLRIGGFWGDELYSEPAVDLSPLYKESKSFENTELKKGERRVLSDIRGKCFEMTLTVPADKVPGRLDIEVLRSPGGEEKTVISFIKGAGGGYSIFPHSWDSVVTIDPAHSTENPDVRRLPPDVEYVTKENSEDLKMQIFADKSSVEVFVNDRTAAFARVYPVRADSDGIALSCTGGDCLISKLDFHTVGSIWEL